VGIDTGPGIEILPKDAVAKISLNPTEKIGLALASLFMVYRFFFHN